MLDLTQPTDVLEAQMRQAARKLDVAKIQKNSAKNSVAAMVYRETMLDQERIIEMIRAELARRLEAEQESAS
jgi:hypothetical protein